MSVESDILDALSARLAALAPEWPIAWPNLPFAPATGTPYQRASLMFAEPVSRVRAEDSTTWRGIFQVDVFYPENLGDQRALDRAGLVARWFPLALRMTKNATTVKVTATPAVASPVQSPGWRSVPVSVPWRVDRVAS